ncbi:MAG TPA: hypothetical protein VL172_02760 [Kofleriaceae bacterium]|nr:hypothetical protein [Kofleriaceae bacterium]
MDMVLLGALLMAAAGAVVYAGVRWWRRPARPAPLEAMELAAAYADVLEAHDAVRAAMSDGDRPREGLALVYARCRELVDAAGQVARSGDAVRRYLGRRTPLALEGEAARLDALAERARDPRAAAAYRMAAQARHRQLDLYHQIGGLYDRIEARLALLTSFLGAVEAMIVRLQVFDLEELHVQVTSISGQLDRLHGEIDLLHLRLEQEPTVETRSLTAGAQA